jgi:hypothetical protein
VISAVLNGLLDAVDDPQVAVVVEGADVAGVQPAVLVERVGGRRREMPVAAHDHGPAHQHLALVREADLDAGQRPADRAGTRRARGVDRRDARRLRHPVHLAQRQAGGVPERDDLVRAWGGADDRDAHLVEAERGERRRTGATRTMSVRVYRATHIAMWLGVPAWGTDRPIPTGTLESCQVRKASRFAGT